MGGNGRAWQRCAAAAGVVRGRRARARAARARRRAAACRARRSRSSSPPGRPRRSGGARRRRRDGASRPSASSGRARQRRRPRRRRRRRARPRRQAPGARHDGHRLPLPDRALRAREGVPLPGARALVVHHQRRRHLRDADAGPRRGPARHRASPKPKTPLPGQPDPLPRRPCPRAGGRRDRPHRPRPPHAPRRRGAGLVPRAVRAVPDAAPRRHGEDAAPSRCRSRTAPTSCAASIPDGREDLALAAAFEIGRLLALSQLSVVSALLRFRAEQFGAGRVRELLAQVLTVPAAGAGRRGARALDLGRFVALEMVGTLAKNPAAMLGPRRPVADPGRPLARERRTRRGDRRRPRHRPRRR